MKKTNLRKLVSSSLSMFSWFKRKRARFNFVQEVLEFNLGSLYWVSLGVSKGQEGGKGGVGSFRCQPVFVLGSIHHCCLRPGKSGERPPTFPGLVQGSPWI